MGNDFAIRAEGLGKKYYLGATVDLRRNLRETVAFLPKMLGRALHGRGEPETDPREFWALRNVSFEVRQGEALGIIGHNGAGKSTLLKILSKVTYPTEGQAEIRGRVGSLLEVGTGFNPELSGRENVYLNGSILGMRKAEIDARFDEIVAFAGTERFLDTPVKRYSSGMRVRLGFAVAAHLDPEILIVDEVLAVGDAAFRKKCLEKLDDETKGGRTVIFVSHNLGVLNRLCGRALMMENGRIVMEGATEDVTAHYLNAQQGEHIGLAEYERDPERKAQFLRIAVCDAEGNPKNSAFGMEEPITLKFRVEVFEAEERPKLAFYITHSSGERILFSDVTDHESSELPDGVGAWTWRVTLPAPLLAPGDYTVTAGILGASGHLHHVPNAVGIQIESTQGLRGTRPGYVYIPLPWRREDG